MANSEINIPYGFCQCGCGKLAPIAKKNRHMRGDIKGQPTKYLRGHSRRKWGGICKYKNYFGIKMPEHPRAHANGYVPEYILIAEKALGKPLPAKTVIHHHSLIDLVICENQAYHLLLHQRARALKACGHSDWRKCVICKKYDAPENLFIHKGLVRHNTCHVKKERERFQKTKSKPANRMW